MYRPGEYNLSFPVLIVQISAHGHVVLPENGTVLITFDIPKVTTYIHPLLTSHDYFMSPKKLHSSYLLFKYATTTLVGPVTRKLDPLILVLPGPNILKYLDPRIICFNFDEIFGPPGTKFSDIFGPP